MTMTRKLYYESAYLTEWQTSIHATVSRPDGCYVILEETAFYPHGGGQPCDVGFINDIPVLDVILEDEEVLHKVERSPEETQVQCRIDWSRRWDHMQHHSGQHLLSAVCLKLYEAKTVSFHLGEDYATIDVELPEISADRLALLEREVNNELCRNHRIDSFVVTGEEAALLPLVKPPKVTDNVRIVQMADVEYNACGGTHVSATGEIGLIKLLKAEKLKGNTRIYFKCGARALAEYHECMGIIGALSTKFNTGKDEIVDRIGKWEQEHKQLQAELTALREKLDSYVIQELLLKRGGGLIAHVFEDRTLKDLQGLAVQLTGKADVPVLLCTMLENKVVLAHSGSLELSCGGFFKDHLGAFQGKGGGSPKQAQAGFPAWEAAASFYAFAQEALTR